jgi:hypothetical protein
MKENSHNILDFNVVKIQNVMFCVGRHQWFGQIYTADGAVSSCLTLVINH